MIKRIIAIILTLVFALTALAGCVQNQPQTPDTQDTQDTKDTPDTETEPPETDTNVPETDDTGDPDPEVPYEQKDIDTLEEGETVYGFSLKETVDFPVLGAVIYRFEHEKTGAELIYIANDDTHRIFDLTFFTDAQDNTGIPHVFEHATTCGSEKYPSKDLFFNLSYQTYNVYMNAMTGKGYTSYPISSLSEAQLLKYADYYSDSCFNPIIMDNESIFKQEAWRYRLPDADSELTIEGTVYSEMLGATSLSRTAYYGFLRTAFPGSIVGYDQGGEPDSIPDMTWQNLRDFHNKYYHPSNCAAYLYGDLENYSEFFKLLDGYFSEYDRKEFAHEDEGYERISGPVTAYFTHPVEAQSPTENETEIYYAFILPGLKDDPEEEVMVNTLSDLIYASSSNIQKRLDAELPHGTFGMYIELDGPDDAFVFMGTHLNPEDEEIFRTIIDEGMEEIAENGFPQEQLDGIMASVSIGNLLARETTGIDFVDDIFTQFPSYYAATRNCWGYIDYVNGSDEMDTWNQEGKYAELAKKWFVDNDLTVCVITSPDPGQKEINDQALKDRLATLKESLSEEEINEIIEFTNTDDTVDDASEYVAQLQAVTVDSLPNDRKEYTVYDDTDEDGIRFINVVAGVDGIGQANIFFDASGLEQDQLLWFRLFTSLVGDLDTDAHTRDELQTLITRYLYNFRVNVSLLEDPEKNVHPYLRMSWIGLDGDLDEGYDLMKEIVFHTSFGNAEKLLDRVSSMKSSLKSSINDSPYSALIYRALATVSPLYSYYASVNMLDLYDFLGTVETMLSEDPDAVIANLNAIQQHFQNRTNAVSVYSGNEASIEINNPLAKDFLMEFETKEIVPVEYEFEYKMQNEALIVEASTQCNILFCPDYELLGIEGNDGGLEAISSLITDKILLPVLRDQYGVYSVGTYAMDDYGVYIMTYRDPNITETFDEYDKLYDYITELDIDQETLDGYILSSYSSYALPAGELTNAINVALNAIYDEEDTTDEYLEQLKSVTPEDIQKYAEMYKKLAENGVRCTSGPASVINEHADMYDLIMNPFNAVDLSQIDFTDFDEDYEYYEAVQFCLENGLLPAMSDTEFGVNEPATNADLMGSTYVLLGGDFDPEACKDLLVQYSLVSVKMKLDGQLKTKDVFDLYSKLTDETIEPTTDLTTLTRGEFAQVLYDFVALLEEE